MKRRNHLRIALLLSLSMLFFLACSTVEPVQDGPAEEEKYQDFAALVKGAEVHEGFFDLYTTDEKLYMAVKPEQLDTDFLMEYKIARGAGVSRLSGGLMLSTGDDLHVYSIIKNGKRLYLVQQPIRFMAKPNTNAARAVQRSFSSSVLATADILSLTSDSALVVEVTDWFVSDLSNISQQITSTLPTKDNPTTLTLKSNHSYVERVKAFPANVNIQAKLTFTSSKSIELNSVPHKQSLSLTIHYTLAKLPENPMVTRSADDRVGYFLTVRKDFSHTDSTFYRRVYDRWRLEKGEKVGEKWRPKEPITYYLDQSIPDEFRESVKAGIEAWNEAFESAGWRDAIQVRDLPEGADAADIRYPTILWSVLDQASFVGYGPHIKDPRTGEILDADVLLEANFIMQYRNPWRDLIQPVTAADAFHMSLGNRRASVRQSDITSSYYCASADFSSDILEQFDLVCLAMINNRSVSGDMFFHEYIAGYVKWLTMHEVGHTLGLRHNFRSSSSTPFDKLHDKEWTARNGVSASVMDYVSVNLAPSDQENGFFWNTGIGSYDRWAISIGYTHDAQYAKELLQHSAEKPYLYGTDEDVDGPGAMDPTINIGNLGDDPIGWCEQRTSIITNLWKEMPEYALANGDRYHELTTTFQRLFNQYARIVAPVVNYIGGAYVNRSHVGDPGGKLPFEPIPLAEQKRALDLLEANIFNATALQIPASVHARFGPNRWRHWGSTYTFDGRIDYPWHKQVSEFQTTVLEALLHPMRLSRILDAETRWGPETQVGIPELTRRLTETIWSELDIGELISTTRRNLQRAWIDVMTELVVHPPDGTPSDARAIARLRLREIQQKIRIYLDSYTYQNPNTDYTLAHLEESAEYISEILDAGILREK